MRRRCTPCRLDDFFAKGRVREDGRLLHDFFLAEVKAPSESTAPWDYYKIRRIIPAQEAAQPLAQSKCALVRTLTPNASWAMPVALPRPVCRIKNHPAA